MTVMIRYGIVLAILVALTSTALTATGLSLRPTGDLIFLALAILLNVTVLLLALRAAAADASYGAQLLNSLVFGVVAGSLIFALSWTLLSVIFPDYLDQWRQVRLDLLAERTDLTAETRATQQSMIEDASPSSQAMAGFAGTLVTSLVVGALAAIVIRKK